MALVGGNRPPVSPAEVRAQLESLYHIDGDSFSVSRYSPEDFLVRFTNPMDLDAVLHGPMPVGTPFYLIWKRWRRQSMASAGALCYKVLIAMRGMPAHIWNTDAAKRILGSSCARLDEAP